MGPALRARRRCVALGGIDAHQIGIRVGGRVPLRLMAYKRSFRYLRTHLLADGRSSGELDHDRDAVYDALRAGHAYIAVDSLAPARGFRFWAGGPRVAPSMGDEAPAGECGRCARGLPRPARLRLLRDGEQVAETAGERPRALDATSPASTASRPTCTRTGASGPGSSRTRSTCGLTTGSRAQACAGRIAPLGRLLRALVLQVLDVRVRGERRGGRVADRVRDLADELGAHVAGGEDAGHGGRASPGR